MNDLTLNNFDLKYYNIYYLNKISSIKNKLFIFIYL